MVMRRIIPVMLVEQHEMRGRAFPVVVTTRAFTDVTRVGDPASTARVLASQLADELIVIRRGGDHAIPFIGFVGLLERIATETSMPMSVGGGVKNIEEAHSLLRSGADKIVLGPAALTETHLVEEVAERFGRQCVVAAVDFRSSPHGPVAMAGQGRELALGPLVSVLRELDRRGVGELLLTDVDRDGSGTGLNVDVAMQFRDAISVPLILAGGCGRADHMLDAFQQSDVDAVAAGTYFARRDQNQFQARALIANAGVSVRVSLV
jgi:cyclase